MKKSDSKCTIVAHTLLESVLCWVFFEKSWETQILVFY